MTENVCNRCVRPKCRSGKCCPGEIGSIHNRVQCHGNCASQPVAEPTRRCGCTDARQDVQCTGGCKSLVEISEGYVCDDCGHHCPAPPPASEASDLNGRGEEVRQLISRVKNGHRPDPAALHTVVTLLDVERDTIVLALRRDRVMNSKRCVGVRLGNEMQFNIVVDDHEGYYKLDDAERLLGIGGEK